MTHGTFTATPVRHGSLLMWRTTERQSKRIRQPYAKYIFLPAQRLDIKSLDVIPTIAKISINVMKNFESVPWAILVETIVGRKSRLVFHKFKSKKTAMKKYRSFRKALDGAKTSDGVRSIIKRLHTKGK